MSPRVFSFLLKLYQLNINDDNRFDDGYYQGVLIAAITEALIGKVDKGWSTATKDSYQRMINIALEVLTHAVNVDKLVPTFQQAVTHAAIDGIWKLQDCRAIEFQPQFFIDHALYGHSQHIRMRAIKCLAELAQKHPDALAFLLELGQNDYVPSIRTFALKEIARSARKQPVGVFLMPSASGKMKGGGGSASDQTARIRAMIGRIWDVMNLGSAYEVGLRVAALQCFGAILPPDRTDSDVQSLARGVRVPSNQVKLKIGGF